MKIKYEADIEHKIVACVDCKYYVRTLGMLLTLEPPRCSHGHTPQVNLVTGRVEKIRINDLDRCSTERRDDYSENCGRKGKYWQPRKHTPENTMRVLRRTENV